MLKLFFPDQLTVLTGASSSYPGEGEATNCEPLVQQARGGGGLTHFCCQSGSLRCKGIFFSYFSFLDGETLQLTQMYSDIKQYYTVYAWNLGSGLLWERLEVGVSKNHASKDSYTTCKTIENHWKPENTYEVWEVIHSINRWIYDISEPSTIIKSEKKQRPSAFLCSELGFGAELNPWSPGSRFRTWTPSCHQIPWEKLWGWKNWYGCFRK